MCSRNGFLIENVSYLELCDSGHQQYRLLTDCTDLQTDLGPVVQSIVSLTSSLRVISLTVLGDSIHIILIFFAEATHIFSAKNFSIFAYGSM